MSTDKQRQDQEYLDAVAERALQGGEQRAEALNYYGPAVYDGLMNNAAEQAWFHKPDQQVIAWGSSADATFVGRLRRRWQDHQDKRRAKAFEKKQGYAPNPRRPPRQADLVRHLDTDQRTSQ